MTDTEILKDRDMHDVPELAIIFVKNEPLKMLRVVIQKL